MAAERITVRLTRKLQKQLTALVKETGKTESEIVRDAIEELCQRRGSEPSCYDIAKKMGIIGAISGGPPDLSTNPKYMEGFGRD
jgi:metal-responsive CopG/Arc/MetJ family transcriptional regulator